jgi:DNA adenine methylase
LLECRPPNFRKYIEPFAGSACLYFNLSPDRAVLGDTNPHLVNFYRVVQRYAGRVYDIFSSLPRDAHTYYDVRARYPDERGAVKSAAYFLYLNRNCFNGIFRVNKAGVFNVPFADSRVPPYPSRESFLGATRLLRSVTLSCADFGKVCRRYTRKGDFVYLDPPYYVPDQRVFREYVPHDFAQDDVRRLSEVLRSIDHRGAYFLMNYPDCDMMRAIARKWNYHVIQTRRTISGDVKSRGNSPEILIYNYEIGG